MEILLLITIVILAIAFINFREYLSNPSRRPQIQTREEQEEINYYKNPYKSDVSVNERALSKEEKIKNSEYGLIVSLLSKLAQSDGKVCELELELMENTILDITDALLLQSSMYQKDEILEILHRIFETTDRSVEELTMSYASFTKGQYKSRLKLVEYMFALAYADNELGLGEREMILDVAAYLEIDNADFNALYDAYESFYQSKREEATLQESYEILGVKEEDSLEEIKKTYKNLVRQYHPDILHHKGLDESIIQNYTQKLQKINQAYEVVKKSKSKKLEVES